MFAHHVACHRCKDAQKASVHLFAGGWRNGLLFDPLQQYGNYSYADVMLYPLAAALSRHPVGALVLRRRHVDLDGRIGLAARQAELEVHGVAALKGDGDVGGVRARHARVAGVARLRPG